MTEQTLNDVLSTLTGAVLAADRYALDVRKSDIPPSLEEIVDAVTAVHAARDSLKATFDTLCQVLDPLMCDNDEVRSSAGVLIEKKWSKPRKAWRHQDLASVVARRIRDLSVDQETGEVLMSPEEQIVALIRYAAPSYWRVKELQTLGIDADGYCETSESTASIIVRPNA